MRNSWGQHSCKSPAFNVATVNGPREARVLPEEEALVFNSNYEHNNSFCICFQENNYFEEAFKAYEKGISLFKWPYVYDIWNTYLTKFLERYKGTKIERSRDLFEQVS